MKALSSIAVAALLGASLPAQAQQPPYQESTINTAPKAIGAGLQIIYRVSGVRDNGGGVNAGVATVFPCTSGSAVNEKLRIAVRNSSGVVAGTQTVTIPPNQTITMATHFTAAFSEDLVIAAGAPVTQGSAHILATSNKIFCSAMIVDAAATVPQGIALHMVRFTPAPGSQE